MPGNSILSLCWYGAWSVRRCPCFIHAFMALIIHYFPYTPVPPVCSWVVGLEHSSFYIPLHFWRFISFFFFLMFVIFTFRLPFRLPFRPRLLEL